MAIRVLIQKKKQFKNLNKIGIKTNLFLNVDPNIIYDAQFIEGCTKRASAKYRKKIRVKLYLKLLKEHLLKDKRSFLYMLDHYRSQNYKIAIDDVGAGYSGFNMIKDSKPEFIKIDMDLVRDIDKDHFKQALMQSFVVLSRSTNIKIIAEGIETKSRIRNPKLNLA